MTPVETMGSLSEGKSSIILTVGKIEAGVAMLLTENLQIVEFPSSLLPNEVESGSLVSIKIRRDTEAEAQAIEEFEKLQEEIYKEFGRPIEIKDDPSSTAKEFDPNNPLELHLFLHSLSQTTATLKWNEVDLGRCEFKGIDCFLNGLKASNSTMLKQNCLKLSGLDMGKKYKAQICLRTTGGNFTSQMLEFQTHDISNLSGLVVVLGFMEEERKNEVVAYLDSVQAKYSNQFVPDATHFVTDSKPDTSMNNLGFPDATNISKGVSHVMSNPEISNISKLSISAEAEEICSLEAAKAMNIPVVRSEWLLSCKSLGKMAPVRDFYFE